jgi:ABC-2 type transport system ATP-binding protein
LQRLAAEVSALPGVEQAAPFGTTLHVVGSDRDRLAASLAPLGKRPGIAVEPGQTSLEDVFIKFMGDAQDNMGGDNMQ